MRENLDKAAYYRPSNLTAIIDVNRLGQRGPTKLEGDMTAYQRRAGASSSSTVIIAPRSESHVPIPSADLQPTRGEEDTGIGRHRLCPSRMVHSLRAGHYLKPDQETQDLVTSGRAGRR